MIKRRIKVIEFGDTWIKFYVSHHGTNIGAFEIQGRTDGTVIDVSDIHIYKQYRGNGYACILMQDIYNECKKLGYTTIQLTDVYNPIAMKVYEKCGYTKTKGHFKDTYSYELTIMA